MKHKVQVGRALITVGSRPEALPPDAIISITRGEGFSLWAYIINTIGNLFLVPGLARHAGLLYAEMTGLPDQRGGQIVSVWHAKEMVPYRDRGAHGWVMRRLGWTFFGAKTQAFFLTFKAHGRIPTVAEAEALVKSHGKHYVSGEQVRPASRPAWPPEQDAVQSQ